MRRWSTDKDPDPIDFDSEECNEHIRGQVVALNALAYDHDGHGALPIRPEILQYIMTALCCPRRGLLKAGGVGMTGVPRVRMTSAGTIDLAWVVGDRTLKIHIPTRDVLLCKQLEGQTYVAVRLGRSPEDDDEELDLMFRWLEEELS